MSNYAKFMKEVISKKRKLEDYETVKLIEECSAIIKIQLPKNLKDLKSLTNPCMIGELHIEKALCDLSASINLMLISIFRKLNLGEAIQTTISLQLADHSLTYPRGIIEDILVKNDRFIFPVDFVVLDMEEDRKIPIILGRPFLTTGKALIDFHDGNLTLRVNGEEVKFNISNAMKFPKEQAECKRVNVLGVDLGMNDVEVVDSVFALEALPVEKEVPKKGYIYKAPTINNSSKKKNTTSDGRVLKQLPAHL
ncbi:uncharacterized protein LOC133824338 [Humulus lupulus]|uniref:uncharacterized protein LOC133824338 n=1 Tax=Humulus lupulus TaxID=3486 RepID=UPI002B405026|nr:uncharacterized protein LOC133824338 [Humulus lupulus]